MTDLGQTKVEKFETDVPKRTKIGRPRKSSILERSENAAPVASAGIEDQTQSRELEKIDAEVRKAHRESQAFLVSKHMARWAAMPREPADLMDTETVLVKLSQNTCATAVTVPRIPTHVSPNVQALVAGSYYMMQKADEAMRQQQQALPERVIDNDDILIAGPPNFNGHGHPSPRVFHPELVSPVQRPLLTQPVQPLPYLYAPAEPRNPRDPGYHLTAATRDHALRPNSQRSKGVDIDLKMAHLRNIRQFNSQYVPPQQSGEVLKAARSAAYAQDTDSDVEMPHVLRPPQQEKRMRLHDRLLREMTVASDKMHYRRRVRFGYLQHTARVCKEVVKSDNKTRGPFETDTDDTGAFVTNLPTVAETSPPRDRILKLGYRRQNAFSHAREQSAQRPVLGPWTDESEMWRTAEEWRQIVASRGASLSEEARRKFGLNRFANEEMSEATVSRAMGIGAGWDVDRQIEELRNNSGGQYYQGESELFRGYVR